jgi:hypothetical protein
MIYIPAGGNIRWDSGGKTEKIKLYSFIHKRSLADPFESKE